MRAVILGLSIWLSGAAGAQAAAGGEDYVLLTVHMDSATVRQRTPAGRVLEFVDVLGRKNRCIYDDHGLIKEIRYSSENGDFTIRFLYTKLGALTTVILADRTAVVFRAGQMQPTGTQPTQAETYAAALERWLAKKNLGQ
jgi:hypothetical protein